MTASDAPCPCTSGDTFGRCCEPFLSSASKPPTALHLMRSRYTAFTLEHADYLLQTWHPARRPPTLEFNPAQRWLGLKIKDQQAGQAEDSTGIVEFVARYKIDGKGFRLHERSRFSRESGHWLYVDGIIDP